MGKELGMWGVDLVTGFAGTITGHVKYLDGSDELRLTPKVDSDGKFIEAKWFNYEHVKVSKPHFGSGPMTR